MQYLCLPEGENSSVPGVAIINPPTPLPWPYQPGKRQDHSKQGCGELQPVFDEPQLIEVPAVRRPQPRNNEEGVAETRGSQEKPVKADRLHDQQQVANT